MEHQYMRISIVSPPLLMLCALTAMAGPITPGPVTLSGLGNGQGWNDGSFYTGYVTLTINGVNYTALCVDALHETAANSTWNALYVPLTDTDILNVVMAAYFPNTPSSAYTSKLYADVIGFLMMAGAGQAPTVNLQHEVWGQLDPAQYNGSSLATSASADISNGSFTNSYGNQVALSFANFGLIVDANYANGGQLQQLFILDPPAAAPEPASMLLIGAGLVGLGLLMRKQCRSKGSAQRAPTI
jgi:hypothetical protein